MEKYYTLKEVREIAKLGRATVYRHVESGKLKAVKIGKIWRIKESDLKKYLGE